MQKYPKNRKPEAKAQITSLQTIKAKLPAAQEETTTS